MWRVHVGLHQSVKLSFMTVGHTKFAPDWCFGLLKQKFRRTKVDCLEDIVNVVESSASVNNAQLVGTQSGETVVKSYDWAGYLASKLKRVPQIKKQHHFVFTSSKPGIVTIKEFTDTETTELRLLKDPRWTPSQEFPEQIQPHGLSLERKWYLYDKIREFCSHETRDLVCPHPEHPRPSSTPAPSPPPPSPLPSQIVPITLPQKRQRICGSCGEAGHNKRTCTQNNSNNSFDAD